MSELKHQLMLNRERSWVPCYLKSEADKVIAELKADYKEACDRLQTANLIKDEQLAATRHNKYKRCMAMAKLCAKNVDHLNSEGYIYEKEGHAKELADCITGTEFYDKWYHRWLELAEKFKPNKEQ